MKPFQMSSVLKNMNALQAMKVNQISPIVGVKYFSTFDQMKFGDFTREKGPLNMENAEQEEEELKENIEKMFPNKEEITGLEEF